MKRPQNPPNIGEFMRTAQPERLNAILGRMNRSGGGDRYLHWDDFRRRPAPEGFSQEEAWVVERLSRNAGLRGIALKDNGGRPFSFGLPDSLSKLLHEIDRGLGVASGLPGIANEGDDRDRYVINSLVQESITSSQLEGAATTRLIAKDMLRSGRPPRDKGERMIVNNFLTMQLVRELRDRELTPALVLEIHGRMTQDTLDKADAGGRFRRADEEVSVVDEIEGTVFHRPPPAGELPGRLAEMCEFANGRSPDYFIHPVVRAIVLHFWLAYDHPFVDGNGRAARALFYWAMLHCKYELFEFVSISEILLKAPVSYYTAFLHTETDENDLTYFILHQAEVIQRAIGALHAYVDEKKKELGEAAGQSGAVRDLNPRQRALVAHALREPGTTYLVMSHMRSHGVSHQTARDDLFGLVKKSLLVVSRAGRSYNFHAASDVRQRLAKLAARPRGAGS
jgi:Fic family protein